MNRLTFLAFTVALGTLSSSAAVAAPPAGGAQFQWRWVYGPCNFQADKSVDELVAMMQRAHKDGYTGLMVNDRKFNQIEGRPENYYRNLKRVRKVADELGLELIPAVADIGYSNGLLAHNPNLAEGLPVKDCEMVVRQGRATMANTENFFPSGGFEEPAGDGGQRLSGWDLVDGWGKSTFYDKSVKHSGGSSLRMENFRLGNKDGDCRIYQKLKLKPWHQYHVSLWIKTQDLSKPQAVLVAVLTDQRSLSHSNLKVKSTQDWTEHHIVFNTLEATEVRFSTGIWGGAGGTIWLDDLSLRETAGVNMLRREGCPVRVTSEDGATEYAEGRDFQKWEDPKLGVVPWAGSYEVWHAEPPLVLATGSRIKEGQKLKVSYYHTVVIYDEQVACCLRHEQVFRIIEDQVTQLHKYLAPRKWMLWYDELRVVGQCELCTRDHQTAGQVLAENVKRVTAIIRKVDPQAEIFVWSDMFDPDHNAVANYYLAGSTLAGSWEGLDPAIRVVNWNHDKADASLKFFADRGHKQILAGYYDSSNWQKQLDGWLAAAAKVKGVEGIMYTTWAQQYDDLEAFAKEAFKP
jgi:hypothetical protein